MNRAPSAPGPAAVSRARRPESTGHWLRLLRWKNLLIVAATQLLAWGCIVWPLRETHALVLTPGAMGALLLSTVCIAGAGYLINDYFDIKIDAINRPGKSILENPVHRRRALVVHTALNAAGVLLAAAVAYPAGRLYWVFWQLATVLLLWWYSTHFKRAFMIGNVVVALLTGLTVALLAVFEPAVWSFAGAPARSGGGLNPFWTLAGFAGFAFLLTWMREIVKDAEDLKGDAAEGCDTVPIRWGLLRAARLAQGIGVATLLALATAGAAVFRSGYVLVAAWIALAVFLPLLLWILRLPGGATSAHYARASGQLKLLMLAGLFTLVLLRFGAF